MKKIFLTIAIAILYSGLYSQNIKLKMADKHFEGYAYIKASELYESLAAQNIETNHVSQRLASCYYYTNQTSKAEQWYSKVMTQEEVDIEDILRYALILQQNKKYSESEKWMKRYYELQSNDHRAKAFLNQGDIIEEIKSQGDMCTLENIGLNTENCEFGGIYVDDELVFVASRKEGVATKRLFAWNEMPFLDLYSISKKDTDSLEKVQLLSKKINSKFHDGPITYNSEGTRAYFTRNNFYKGRYGKDKKGVNKLKIFWTEKSNDEWDKIHSVHFNSDEYSVGHPTLTIDEKLLYFVSDMPGGIGGTDIYYAQVNEDGSLGDPVNLGAPINTEGNEMFPFIYRDGTLFFSSDGHVGLGGLDIFYAIPNSNGKFKDVKNAGIPMNSAKDDFAFFLSKDERTGYISSNRDNGKGDDDIYYFELIRQFKPQYIVKGQAKDKESGELLANTKVNLNDEAGTIINSIVTGPKGAFSFTVEGDSKYSLVGTKEEYAGDSKNISTIDLGDKKVVEVDLELIRKNVSLHGIITDKETGALLPGVDVVLTNKKTGEQELDITTTEDADFRHALANVEVNDKISYLIKLSRAGYLGKTVSLNMTIDKYGEIQVHNELDISLDKIDVGTDLAKIVDLQPIYFDLGKWNIRSDAAIELDKIVEVMKENPKMIIELRSHTDSRGSASSNMRLSDRRAKSSANYIISHGIDKNRITGKGYGESKLVNRCKDGVNCSEEEHQQNRRTEFIIIKM